MSILDAMREVDVGEWLADHRGRLAAWGGTALAAGRKPINCGVRDVHIGGLAQVPALVAALGARCPDLRRIVRVHVGLTHKDDEVLAAADALVRILVDAIPRPEAAPRTVAEAAAAFWRSKRAAQSMGPVSKRFFSSLSE